MHTATPASTPSPAAGQEVSRVEVRPGLTMIRRKTLMPDGRYLLYYDFERSAAAPAQEEK